MIIQVSSAYGVGVGNKSSFDSALKKLNLHEYNLVEYSSVIPEDCTVKEVDEFDINLMTGYPCAVVMAKETVAPDQNKKAISHLKYIQSDSNSGVFVEGNGSFISDSEIRELCDNREGYNWNNNDIHEISCTYESEDKFVTCLSIAVFGGIKKDY